MDKVLIAAAHPTEQFGPSTAQLLEKVSGAEAVTFTPRPGPIEVQARELEEARGGRRWLFWGMSGGGWLALAYARLFPEALSGIIVESACLCFRERLADPSCALSPFFPAWRERLTERGLIEEGSHARAEPAADVEWIWVEGLGEVWRRKGGPALLVSPMPVDARMRAGMKWLWEFDARAWVPSLRVPALVIAGSVDPVVPPARVRAVHEALSGSRFVLAEGGSHVPSSAEHPAAVAAIRQFVAGH